MAEAYKVRAWPQGDVGEVAKGLASLSFSPARNTVNRGGSRRQHARIGRLLRHEIGDKVSGGPDGEVGGEVGDGHCGIVPRY